jgi:O-antigen/teichoic acid export membrane protein
LSKILYNAKWSLLARVLNVVLKAIAVIYLARLLGPNEFGFFTLILTAAALITVFIDLGISPATARFLAEEKWGNRKILFSSVIILLGVYFTIAGLLLLFGGHLFKMINAAVLDDFSVYLILLIFFQVKHQFFKKCYEGLKRVDLSSKVSLVFDWTPGD